MFASWKWKSICETAVYHWRSLQSHQQAGCEVKARSFPKLELKKNACSFAVINMLIKALQSVSLGHTDNNNNNKRLIYCFLLCQEKHSPQIIVNWFSAWTPLLYRDCCGRYDQVQRVSGWNHGPKAVNRKTTVDINRISLATSQSLHTALKIYVAAWALKEYLTEKEILGFFSCVNEKLPKAKHKQYWAMTTGRQEESR